MSFWYYDSSDVERLRLRLSWEWGDRGEKEKRLEKGGGEEKRIIDKEGGNEGGEGEEQKRGGGDRK